MVRKRFAFSLIKKLVEKKNIALIIYKILTDLIFSTVITDTWAYLGAVPDNNYWKYLISWLFFFYFVVLDSMIINGDLKFCYEFMLYLSIIPSGTVWWVKNTDNVAMTYILIYWLIWSIVTIILSRGHFFGSTISGDESKDVKMYGIDSIILALFLIEIIFTLFCSYKYGNFRFFVRFEDVYTYRLDSDNTMNSLEAYLFEWSTNIILPFLLVYFLNTKKYIFTVITILLLLMSYSIYGEKGIFFMILIAIGIWIFQKINLARLESESILFTINLATFISIFLAITQVSLLPASLIYRVTTGPAEGHFYYFDFFQTHEFLYLRQSIMRFFLPDPYGESISVLIGSDIKYNTTGAYNNFNNGVFSDAYANFGFLGVLLFPILIVFTLKIFSDLTSKIPSIYKYTLLCGLLMYVMSTGYFQWLLSGGLIIAAFILYIYSKNKKRVLGF